MGNHFHLLLQSGQTSLPEFMRSLLTGYAVYFNRKHKRSGHLFQNRYKSVLCEKDEYLLPLTRYIHLNPVKASMVTFQYLDKYSWTGHKEICRGEQGIIDKDEILSFFGKTRNSALVVYKGFIKKGLNVNADFEGGGLKRSGGGLKAVISRSKAEKEMYDERILGSGSFVEEVLERTENLDRRSLKIKSSEDLLEKIGLYYKIPREVILKTREHRAREARDTFLYMGQKYLGESITTLGEMLSIHQSAASLAIKRVRKRGAFEEIEEKILG